MNDIQLQYFEQTVARFEEAVRQFEAAVERLEKFTALVGGSADSIEVTR